jgi:hypothetical protein
MPPPYPDSWLPKDCTPGDHLSDYLLGSTAPGVDPVGGGSGRLIADGGTAGSGGDSWAEQAKHSVDRLYDLTGSKIIVGIDTPPASGYAWWRISASASLGSGIAYEFRYVAATNRQQLYAYPGPVLRYDALIGASVPDMIAWRIRDDGGTLRFEAGYELSPGDETPMSGLDSIAMPANFATEVSSRFGSFEGTTHYWYYNQCPARQRSHSQLVA